MTKKTLCLFFVLALIAQICAVPTDKVLEDAEKEGKRIENQAVNGAEKAEKDATDVAANAAGHAKPEGHTKSKGHAKSDGHAKPEGHTKHEQEHAKRNAGELAHGAAHGGRGVSKPGAGGAGFRPVTKVIKGSEELGKKLVDQGVKIATDFLGLLRL